MGLKDFSAFLKQNNVFEPINVYERINQYKREHANTQPVIVFDLSQTLAMLTFCENDANLISYCGGRERILIERAKDFFKKLITLNCKLVFVAEGPVKNDKLPIYIGNKKSQLSSSKKLLNDRRITFDNCSLPRSAVRIIPIYYTGITAMAKKYGTYHISLLNECDKDVAYYANKYNALAVMSSDTDMLFFDGSWEVWMTHDFNVGHLTTKCIDKKKLGNKLHLNSLQMSLFASVFNTLTQTTFQRQKNFELFNCIASYLSENIKETNLNDILKDSVIERLKRFLQNNTVFKLKNYNKENLIKEIDFYNLANYHDVELKDPSWIGKLTYDYGHELLQILHKYEFPYCFFYCPYDTGFGKYLMEMKCRQVGIVLYSEWIKSKKIVTLTFHIFEKDYEKIEKHPIYPENSVPKLAQILGYDRSEITLSEKLEILIWTIFGEKSTNQWSKDFLKEIKRFLTTHLFVPKLTLQFLIKNKQITKTEANILLISLKISERNSHPNLKKHPTVLNKRCIQLGHMYTRTHYFIETSLLVCGFAKYNRSGYYDGFIFQNIFSRTHSDSRQIKLFGDFSNIIF